MLPVPAGQQLATPHENLSSLPLVPGSPSWHVASPQFPTFLLPGSLFPLVDTVLSPAWGQRSMMATSTSWERSLKNSQEEKLVCLCCRHPLLLSFPALSLVCLIAGNSYMFWKLAGIKGKTMYTYTRVLYVFSVKSILSYIPALLRL